MTDTAAKPSRLGPRPLAPHEKYRLDDGDVITVATVAERLARWIGNTVDPTAPGHVVRAACVQVVRDLPSLLADLVDESEGRAAEVEAREEAARLARWAAEDAAEAAEGPGSDAPAAAHLDDDQT